MIFIIVYCIIAVFVGLLSYLTSYAYTVAEAGVDGLLWIVWMFRALYRAAKNRWKR